MNNAPGLGATGLGSMARSAGSAGNMTVASPAASLGQTRQTAEVSCPRSMVGRVIGKNGETIKALQIYTGCLIQIDQSTDPTRVTISGTPQSLSLAINMVTDICKGTFKGFALLRQLIQPQRSPGGTVVGTPLPRPVYAPGYGLIPPSQLYGSDDSGVLQQGTVQLLGAQPAATTLVQPGFQYVQTTQLADGQIMLGMPSTVPTHSLAQQDGTTLLSAMPIQQLQPLQQVYGLPNGGFATQVTYHTPHELTAVSNPSDQLLYQAPNTFNLQQAQLGNMHGSNANKVLVSAGVGATNHNNKPAGLRTASGIAINAGRLHGASGSGSGWVDAGGAIDGASTTLGQVAVDDLLGGNNGTAGNAGNSLGGAGLGLQGRTVQTPSASNAGQGQLLQVIGPEGQISYYLQGSDN